MDLAASGLSTATISNNGNAQLVATLDLKKLKAAIEQVKTESKDLDSSASKVIQVTVNSGSTGDTMVVIPAAAIAHAQQSIPDAIIQITTDKCSYRLPVSVIDVPSIASRLDTTADQVTIQVRIAEVTGLDKQLVESSIEQAGAFSVITPIIFSVYAESKGKMIEIADFGKTYVERMILIPGSLSANQTTAVRIDPATGKLYFVPAIFRQAGDGRTEVIMKRNGNSIYSVVSHASTFTDIAKHWAMEEITLLGSKMIVNGTDGARFEPNRQVTRAEFTAMLVRVLGLASETTESGFEDVKPDAWYAGAIAAARKVQLVNGVDAHLFNPNGLITREQMAVMTASALKFIHQPAVPNSDAAAALAVFNDAADVSAWALDAAATMVESKLMLGMSSTTFAPRSFLTRGQAAVILRRFLDRAEFIND